MTQSNTHFFLLLAATVLCAYSMLQPVVPVSGAITVTIYNDVTCNSVNETQYHETGCHLDPDDENYETINCTGMTWVRAEYEGVGSCNGNYSDIANGTSASDCVFYPPENAYTRVNCTIVTEPITASSSSSTGTSGATSSSSTGTASSASTISPVDAVLPLMVATLLCLFVKQL